MSQPNNPRNPNLTKLGSSVASSSGQRQQQANKKQPLQKTTSSTKSKRLSGTQSRNTQQGKK